LKEEAIIFCKATLLSWIEAELEGGAGPPLPDVPGGVGVLYVVESTADLKVLVSIRLQRIS
jgi:hypothetical protein